VRTFAQTVLLVSLSAAALFAGDVPAPEIDASAGAAALALLGGGMLILRSRRKR
jgi:hypothetical protein